MNITKFGQSCFTIEVASKKILIDPGSLLYDQKFHDKEWKNIDILLLTHRHGDHLFIEAIEKIIADSNPEIFSTSEVENHYPDLPLKIVREGDLLEFEGFKIEVVHAEHGYLPRLKGGNVIFENVGFVIDDRKKRIYHASDTISFDHEIQCDLLLLPLSGHGLVLDAYDGAKFAKETQAQLTIPIHLDNPTFPPRLKAIEEEFAKEQLEVRFMEIGESLEV